MAVNETAEETVKTGDSGGRRQNPGELYNGLAEGTGGSYESWSLFSTSIYFMDFQ